MCAAKLRQHGTAGLGGPLAKPAAMRRRSRQCGPGESRNEAGVPRIQFDPELPQIGAADQSPLPDYEELSFGFGFDSELPSLRSGSLSGDSSCSFSPTSSHASLMLVPRPIDWDKNEAPSSTVTPSDNVSEASEDPRLARSFRELDEWLGDMRLKDLR
mmetsp:Transcript_78410/g.149038  ORF Transcript_78410/g.149038 Transcript_78410/m.149038 type:complete len:158 (-) Transcript_78410:61-534(-)